MGAIANTRRLQVGRDERRGVDEDDLWDGCESNCPCCDWDPYDPFDDDDEGFALLGVAMTVASLHRPFAGLRLPAPSAP